MKNKKIFRIVLGVLILALILPCHVSRAQEFNAGLFAGTTASQVDGDSYWGFKKLGLTAGAFVNREISGPLFWQLEIKYAARGAYEGFGPDDPSVNKWVYRYIEFPLGVHYTFQEKIQTEIGLSPDVLIHYAEFDEYGKLPPSSYPDNHRFGLNGFAGIQYWFSESTSVGIRYTYGLVSFREKKSSTIWWWNGWHHNVLSLSLQYKILSH